MDIRICHLVLSSDMTIYSGWLCSRLMFGVQRAAETSLNFSAQNRLLNFFFTHTVTFKRSNFKQGFTSPVSFLSHLSNVGRNWKWNRAWQERLSKLLRTGQTPIVAYWRAKKKKTNRHHVQFPPHWHKVPVQILILIQSLSLIVFLLFCFKK